MEGGGEARVFFTFLIALGRNDSLNYSIVVLTPSYRIITNGKNTGDRPGEMSTVQAVARTIRGKRRNRSLGDTERRYEVH